LSKANPDDDTVAQNFFRQAIDLDPTFAAGYSALALSQLQADAVYQKLSLLEAQSSAEALARRAFDSPAPMRKPVHVSAGPCKRGESVKALWSRSSERWR
jgi:hypothetical protein